MVYSGESIERVRRTGMEPQRSSKPPLHNFNLPFSLKWGTQRQLRCMKLPDSSVAATARGDDSNNGGLLADRYQHQTNNRSPSPSKFFAVGGFKSPRPRIGRRGGVEEGIEEVREKIMLDLKTAANKMKHEILREEVSEDDDYDVAMEEVEEEELQSLAPTVSVAAAGVSSAQNGGPWNLRTRRASCKSPIVGNSITVKGLRYSEEKKLTSSYSSPSRSESAKSPRLRGDKREMEEEKKERPKFSVALSRQEIEEDFRELLGHRPARRPKKRPRNVQRQLDYLFPGLFLTEVSHEIYKVPELPDNGKR